MTDNTDTNSDITVVHTCYSHFIKRVSNNIDKKFKTYRFRKSILMEGISAMAFCRILDELNQIFDEIMTVLLARNAEQSESSIIRLGLRSGQNVCECTTDCSCVKNCECPNVASIVNV